MVIEVKSRFCARINSYALFLLRTKSECLIMFDEKFMKTNFIMVFIYLKKSILSVQNVKACMQYGLIDSVIDVR